MVDGVVPLVLREAAPEDLPRLLAWTRTPSDLAQWAGSTLAWPLDMRQLRAMLTEAPTQRRRHLVAVLGSEVLAIGHASIALSEDGQTARIGRILLDPAHRGRGAGAELIEAVVAAAAKEPGVTRLTLGVLTDNDVARRHYERLGFAATGEAKTVHVAGKRWESTEMSRRA